MPKVRKPPAAVVPIEEFSLPSLEAVTLEAPLAVLDAGYLSRHVEARLNTELQRQALRRLTQGLRQAGEVLEDGRRVQSQADAIKWLLEQLVIGDAKK
jgi:hypothetical protein